MDQLKKLLFITGTRADYGKIKPLIFASQKAGFSCDVFTTGMHMLSLYGLTMLDVKRDFAIYPFMNMEPNSPMDDVLANTISGLGKYVREKREALRAKDRRYSLRQVAVRIEIEPSYLSKIERGEQTYLSEEKIVALANDLEEDPDVMLALSGKVSKDVQEIIRKRPQLFTQLIRDLKNLPDHAVLRIVREVRDGDW